MKKFQVLCLTVLFSLFAGCSKNPGESIDAGVSSGGKSAASTLASPVGDVVGKVTVGYQGWFTAAGDGSPQNNWGHQNLESWPDVREYATTYQTTLPNLGNGQPAKMFSSWDQSTVNKHFEWMQSYGIDCAAVQRFCNEITPGSAIKTFRDGIAARVRSAAQTYGRKFYVMYDASGWGNLAAIKTDWTNTITGSLNLLSSAAYAKQNGKPVVSIYGLGYASHPSSAADALDLINWFKAQGCYVVGSVPGQWRTGTGDSKAGFINTYKAFNMISGWAVGRATDASYAPWVTGDRDFCNANGMDYQPCAYPGTSFHNTNPGSPQNQFPRNHGDFLWTQFATFKNAGVQSVYIAMFDEMNEATQIFKTAENASQAPAGQWYLNLDADGVAVSSDFYLRLTGDGGRMLKGQIPYSATHPTAHIAGGGTLANGTYKIVNRNSGLALDAKGQGTVNGTPVQQWSYSGANNQRWTVTSLGGGQYKIVGVQSGRSLDVTGQSLTDGAKIQLYDASSGNNQKWIITATSGGYYSIKGVHSNKMMEVAGNSTATGALVQQWASTGSNSQQWAFQTP
ncbi:RICIN domain-containing protein [Hufsiella ginkgonis]|uniref:Ricin B lectin domain-containing protein n=1 Tax=Hufsiella ginkgonis TaxID=2695274 RepID=A0A7K1XSS6_9SPHI|nr:RICIN domain-containing protein [Hufsiella ginkgonis]MXV14055.1 hypothetical protein [Hufsiella ginkgonis]